MYMFNAVIDRVIDGDTFVMTIDAGFNMFTKQKVRLLGINCPEMSTPDGRAVKAIVEDMLAGKSVVIQTTEKDSFGRWLGTVYFDGMNVNQWILDNRFAVVYTK
ncbi:hypothetical protein JCM17380_24480 [Desulfosporosinus burensis]